MIFECRTSGNEIEYKINWDTQIEMFSCLFLRYRNVSKIILLENKTLKIIDEQNNGIIPIFPRQGIVQYERLSGLPYAKYKFELFVNENCNDVPLRTKEILNSPNIQVHTKEIPIDGHFADFQISCRYKISTSFLQLSLKGLDNERFILPDMIKKEEEFMTHCMVHKGYSKYLNIMYSPEIRDFINKGD